MINMVQKQQIILDYYKRGLSIREISRQTRLHRKTIKAHIEKYKQETGFDQLGCEGVVLPPEYDSSARKPRKLTEQIKAIIREFIQANERKVNNRMRKQCMCATDMHEELVNRGFDIGYTTVCQFVKTETHRRTEKFIKQHHAPGKSAEFDWGHCKLFIGGKLTKLNLAVFSLPYSNRRWSYLFDRQDTPSFLWAHVLFFKDIGGIPHEIVYDNMKTAVAKFSYNNRLKQPTTELLKLSTFHIFTPRFCNAYKGNEKGHVENSVEFVRRKSFCVDDHFDSLEHANKHLSYKVQQLNGRKSSGQELTNFQRFENEIKHLGALPASTYDIAVSDYYKVSKYSSIQVDNNQYSVPDFSSLSSVQAKVYPDRICIYNLQGQWLAQHQRLTGKNSWSLTLEHYRITLMRKPGAVANSMALNQASTLVKDIFYGHFQDRPVEFIKLLNYLSDNSISFDSVGSVIKIILDKAPHMKITFDYLKCQLEANRNSNDPPSSHDQPCPLSKSILQSCGQQLNDYQTLF